MPRYSVAESANTHPSIVPFVFESSLSSSSSLSFLSNRQFFCRRLHRRRQHRTEWMPLRPGTLPLPRPRTRMIIAPASTSIVPNQIPPLLIGTDSPTAPTDSIVTENLLMNKSSSANISNIDDDDEEQQYPSSVVEVPSGYPLALTSASSSFGSGNNITKQAVSDKAGTVVSSSTDQLDSFVVHTVSSSTIHAPVSDSREGTTQTETNNIEPNAVSTSRRSLVIISGLIFAAVAIGTLEKGSLIDYEMIASVQKRRYVQLYLTGGRTASSDTLSTRFGACDSFVDLPAPLRPSDDNATTNNSTITYALYLIAIVGIIALLVRTRMPYDPVADGGSNSSAEHQNVNGDSERDNNEFNVSHNHDDDSDNINDF